MLHTARSPAACLEIGPGRILITVGESLQFGDSWKNSNRLFFLLSGSPNLEDHSAVLISMGILMEAACQVGLTVCLVPGCSGKSPCLLLSPSEQQIAFHLHRDRLPWSICSPPVGLAKVRKTYPPVKIEGLFQIGTPPLPIITNIEILSRMAFPLLAQLYSQRVQQAAVPI